MGRYGKPDGYSNLYELNGAKSFIKNALNQGTVTGKDAKRIEDELNRASGDKVLEIRDEVIGLIDEKRDKAA